ncbi:pantoate--beta-alanine ligase [Ochrobactrum sp. XJ1]|nr:pantoate--beta-alanine ligase [Ochrobactrum sp. XJ1]
MSVPIVASISDLREQIKSWRRAGQTIGVVPTMGGLHEGHLSLVRAAKQSCDRVIVTLFVNPRQFNNEDDYRKYPRTEEIDAKLLAPLGVDVLFLPDGRDIYPDNHATSVIVSGVSKPLEGVYRPGHFDGVATVVTILFNITSPDRAFFGEKDWQQLQVVRTLVRDLKLPIDVVACPTIRSTDGLALSSRNMRLSADARQKAAKLSEALMCAAECIALGEPSADVLARARSALGENEDFVVEYLEMRDAETLDEATAGRPARLLASVWLDGVRLIDNVPLVPPMFDYRHLRSV